MGDSFRVNTGTVPEGFIRVECGSTCERGGDTMTIIGRGVDEGMIVVREEGGEITVCSSLEMKSFTEISKEKLKIQAEDRYFDTNKYRLRWKDNGQEKLRGKHDGSPTVHVVQMGTNTSFKVKTWGNGYTGVWWNDTNSRGELRGSPQTKGYLQCNVRRAKFLLHRIIATACFPRPVADPRCEVNHKDGYRQNNSYKNLEWCTNDENNDDKFLRQGTDLLIRTGRLLGIRKVDDFKKYLEEDLEKTVTTQFNEYEVKKNEFMTANNKGETLTDREFDRRKYRERVTKQTGVLPSENAKWERAARGKEEVVSTDGRVWSRRTTKPKQGKPQHIWVQCPEVVDTDGYIRTLETRVQDIMVKAWKIEKLREEVQDEVNHKDGYRWNNSIDNLEWCTKKENLENAWKRQCIDVLLRETRSNPTESIRERITRFIAHALEKWKTYESSRADFFDERIERREPEAFVTKYTKEFKYKLWRGADRKSFGTGLAWANEYWGRRNLPELYDDKISKLNTGLTTWLGQQWEERSAVRKSFQAVVGKESFGNAKDARSWADDYYDRALSGSGNKYWWAYWGFLTNELVVELSKKRKAEQRVKRAGKKPRKGGRGRGLYELYGDLRI